ncbi:MAG TPA: glycosyltransferase family 9 protein [Allosphingosinicella sp.]|jgi:hypothetical protein|nr:glycosyltransferase family 9 protein [Allosphingosinicella sp.]
MSLPETDWTRAMREGDYDRAWSICERALAERDPATRDDHNLPCHLRWVWDGRPFDGRHVLVRCYHGLGDTLQFARYLPLLRRRAASVTLEVQPRLVCLLADIGVDRLVPFDPAHRLPESDCDIEIMELAFALRTPPTRIRPPYLHAAPAVLPSGTIGLCFEAGEWDPERSIPPDLLRPLCGTRSCISLVSAPTDIPVLNRDGCPFDMEATASLVAGVDLVITVDTMIAHLAGAMNKPVWLLLKHEPDWRWSPAAGRSDWYPSMRLYTQPKSGDWASVAAQVARDLEAMPAGQRREGTR